VTVDTQIKEAATNAEQDKDAILYQWQVKSFFANYGHDIGEFPGLISKLDYVTNLGGNTLWLLRFRPSPLPRSPPVNCRARGAGYEF
jgi:glycosidase